MNSRQRIRAALNHEKYDGLAIDFGAMRSTGISAIAYNKLLVYLGIEGKCAKVYDIFQQLAEPDRQVVDILGGDVLQIHRLCPAFGIPVTAYKPYALKDGSSALVPFEFNPVKDDMGNLHIINANGVKIATMPDDGFYFDQVIHRCENVETTNDVMALEFGQVSENELDFLEEQAKYIYNETDKASLLCFGGNIFEQGQLDFGYEKFYMDLALNPEMPHCYFNRLSDMYLNDLAKILDRIGKYIDIIQFGDDLGTQIAPQISVDMYKEMIFPYHKKQFSFVRENYSNVNVFLHSCGAIFDLIPFLIKAGVQILNPVQISASGMNPKKLKETYGKDIVFWGGGADMQGLVQHGSIEEIKAHVRNMIEIFNCDNTGFVFTQVHNIQSDISPEKVCAIYKTAIEYANREKSV